MSDIAREELSYAVERYLAQKDANFLTETGEGETYEPDATPYIQEGDVDDVITAIEALGYQIVKA